MTRVLVALVLAGGAVYAINTFLLPSGSRLFDDEENQAPHASSTQTASTSRGEEQQADPLTPPADASSPHAIVAEASPPAPSATTKLRPTLEPEKLPLDASRPTLPDIGETQIDRVKITARASIQQGPSASTPIIGIAHPGAEAQVISRDSDWAQIIDPSSKKTGWVHSQFLAPQTEASSTSGQVDAALEQTDEAATPEASLKKPDRHVSKRKRHKRGFALRYRLRRFF